MQTAMPTAKGTAENSAVHAGALYPAYLIPQIMSQYCQETTAHMACDSSSAVIRKTEDIFFILPPCLYRAVSVPEDHSFRLQHSPVSESYMYQLCVGSEGSCFLAAFFAFLFFTARTIRKMIRAMISTAAITAIMMYFENLASSSTASRAALSR